MLELYTYYRSVSAHRVRIALNYKGIPYNSVYIDEDRDEQSGEAYLKRNPQGLVPALVVNDGLTITQSSAILEYLEERYPERSLLPADVADRARVRSFSQVLIADTNPTNILRVYRYMRDEMHLDHAARRRWYEHWAHNGLSAVESLLETNLKPGRYCHGDTLTLADVCLVPQMANAEANGLDLSAYPIARRIYRSCSALSAFQSAAPLTQADRLAKAVSAGN